MTRSNSNSPRRARAMPSPKAKDPAQPTMAMPSIAAMAQLVSDLWNDPDAHHKTAEQACALEQWMVAAKPVTAADAVAQMAVILSKMDDLADSAGRTDGYESKTLHDAAIGALALLARHAGFDLAGVCGCHLSDDQKIIAKGEESS